MTPTAVEELSGGTPPPPQAPLSITADSTAVLADPARLDAVRRYEILDAPIATVSIVDADRVWFAAAKGLDGVKQAGTEPGLCASAFCADGPYVVTDAAADPRTLGHPLVRGELGLRFYAAAPIVTTDGHHLGTVTAIDAMPRQLTETQTTVLGHLADLVAQHLELRLAALTAASPGARAYYDRQRARGASYNAALRQLANRLVGILHGCLKTGTPYDEATAWPHHLIDAAA